MSAVVDLRKTDDPRDALHRAVRLLVEGRVVAFPTETVYIPCAHALVPAAVQKLARPSGGKAARGAGGHPELIVKGLQEALDYVPSLDRVGQRLARRCWPGPVTLAFPVGSEVSLFQSLPPETRDALAPDGCMWTRVPAHAWIQDVLRLVPAPLVGAGEHPVGSEPAATVDGVLAFRGDDVDLILDDGECRYAGSSTVVRVAEGGWSLERAGVVSETLIRRLASEMFLFVCTGNTCRSPLAEGFFRKMLAARLKCAEDELADRGYMVLSAGLSADTGLPASPESVEVARRYGVDLRSHESQPVTDRLLEQADRIFVMTRAHKEALLSLNARLSDRVELLARDQSDIPDPIGAGPAEYEACRAAIEPNLRAILDALPI